MDDATWERWAGLGGILFVILLVVSAFLPGSPPMQTDSAKKIANYITNHRDEIRWAGYLAGVSTVPFLWWIGSIWARMRRAEAGNSRLAIVGVGGAVYASLAATLGGLVVSVVAIRGVTASGGVTAAKFWFTLGGVLTSAASFGAAVFVAAVSALALRKGMFPRWLGWAGALLAVAWLVAGVSVASERKAVLTIGFVVFLVFLVWVLVVSFLILTDKSRAAPSAMSTA